MDLRARLAQFDRSRPPDAAVVSSAARQAGGGRPLEALLARGAHWVGRAPCGYLRIEEDVGPPLWPGPPSIVVPTRAFALASGQACPAHDAGPWAVLDTETTGLSGGVGTIVFLAAVILWDEAGARRIQYFLPEPAGERAMLAALGEDLQSARALVTYNGRSFDLPRLRARMRIHRLDEDWLALPHLDLLHPVRRLGVGWMPDARLPTVEREFLGSPRDADDIPGREAPLIYQAYLADGTDRGLGPIADHNRRDVESLLALSGVVAAAYLGAPHTRALPPQAHLAVARLLLARGELTDAARLLGEVAGADDCVLAERALTHLARCHRKLGNVDAALAALARLRQMAPSSTAPLVEIAKIQEHVCRDFAAARAVVQEALRLASVHELRASGDPEATSPLLHRLGRIERRLLRDRPGRK